MIECGDNLKSRSGFRYSDTEVEVLKQAGEIPTNQIAGMIGRSLKSVQKKLNSLMISPYDNDGRYTAAEISRLTGIAHQTLIEWLNQGKIPGEKVGRAWRIIWDGVTPIKPSWNGKDLASIDPNFTKGRSEYCLNCQTPLQGKKVNYFCTRVCRVEYIVKVNEQKRKEI